MPIEFTNLSAEDAAAARAAIEASQKNREERERREMEERRAREAEERARREAAEEAKEAAERKARLARDKKLREEMVAEEARQQALSSGLSGLKLTIPAPSVISRSGSGSSMQSKGKRKATEYALPSSTYVFSVSVSVLPFFMPVCIDPSSLHATLARLLEFLAWERC
jgi:membrane protein involved in colicin uptake